MDLKFSFGGGSNDSHEHSGHTSEGAHGITLPFAGAATAGSKPPLGASSVLELSVSLADNELVCEGLSGDGVSYASASKPVQGEDPAALAAALRSVIARCGAELPDPLIDSISGVVLSLGGHEAGALEALGLTVSEGSTQLAAIDEALQARTGVRAGTPIRRRL